MLFLYTLTRIGYQIDYLMLSLIITVGMLIIPLFYSYYQSVKEPSEMSLMVDIQTCHLLLRMKSKTECSFWMHRLFVKTKRLALLFIANQLLVEFIHILTAFYYLAMSLILSTHLLRDASASGYKQVELNCKRNYLF